MGAFQSKRPTPVHHALRGLERRFGPVGCRLVCLSDACGSVQCRVVAEMWRTSTRPKGVLRAHGGRPEVAPAGAPAPGASGRDRTVRFRRVRFVFAGLVPVWFGDETDMDTSATAEDLQSQVCVIGH